VDTATDALFQSTGSRSRTCDLTLEQFPALTENSLLSRQFDHLDTSAASLLHDAPSIILGTPAFCLLCRVRARSAMANARCRTLRYAKWSTPNHNSVAVVAASMGRRG